MVQSPQKLPCRSTGMCGYMLPKCQDGPMSFWQASWNTSCSGATSSAQSNAVFCCCFSGAQKGIGLCWKSQDSVSAVCFHFFRKNAQQIVQKNRMFTKFRCRTAGGISRENGGNTRENGGNTRKTAEIPGNVGYMLLRKHHEGLFCCQSASGDSGAAVCWQDSTTNRLKV